MCAALLLLASTGTTSFAEIALPANPEPSSTGSPSETVTPDTGSIPPRNTPEVAALVGESSSPATPAGSRSPDWNGVWRDTGILFGAQLVVTGIVYTFPESVSSWSKDQKKSSFKKYAQNFVDPVFDKDKFYLNYVFHPYWGATYYTRARERGLDKSQSFVYSAVASTLFEFGIECFFEKPSIQDLIATPVAGSLIGAYVFEPWRDAIKRKPGLSWYDHAALVFTDPIGVLSSGVERLFDIKSPVRGGLYVPQLRQRSAEASITPKNSGIGVFMQFIFN